MCSDFPKVSPTCVLFSRPHARRSARNAGASKPSARSRWARGPKGLSVTYRQGPPGPRRATSVAVPSTCTARPSRSVPSMTQSTISSATSPLRYTCRGRTATGTRAVAGARSRRAAPGRSLPSPAAGPAPPRPPLQRVARGPAHAVGQGPVRPAGPARRGRSRPPRPPPRLATTRALHPHPERPPPRPRPPGTVGLCVEAAARDNGAGSPACEPGSVH